MKRDAEYKRVERGRMGLAVDDEKKRKKKEECFIERLSDEGGM